MTIDIEKAISFLGYPVAHPELDDFLEDSGAPRRLGENDRPSATLKLDNGSVQLQFSDSYEETHGPAFSKGFLYLEDVTVENGKYADGVGNFTGTIPYGIRVDMNDKDIIATLGEPDYKGEFMGAYFITYHEFKPKLTINFRLDKATKELTFVRFFKPELE